jgi:hypothetical protein
MRERRTHLMLIGIDLRDLDRGMHSVSELLPFREDGFAVPAPRRIEKNHVHILAGEHARESVWEFILRG